MPLQIMVDLYCTVVLINRESTIYYTLLQDYGTAVGCAIGWCYSFAALISYCPIGDASVRAG